ncbi:uncharacterized protein LOC118736505 [Rhagoletis pomonella]|uniref:uncharacterized protein LOC118736505 n=1 Tax=Rhagoletis pomonella TaxID=28610 RepID=UPI00177C4D4F|nr:uncharacterized protein LOC118736505 [Rhagoletis pomonella]
MLVGSWDFKQMRISVSQLELLSEQIQLKAPSFVVTTINQNKHIHAHLYPMVFIYTLEIFSNVHKTLILRTYPASKKTYILRTFYPRLFIQFLFKKISSYELVYDDFVGWVYKTSNSYDCVALASLSTALLILWTLLKLFLGMCIFN